MIQSLRLQRHKERGYSICLTTQGICIRDDMRGEREGPMGGNQWISARVTKNQRISSQDISSLVQSRVCRLFPRRATVVSVVAVQALAVLGRRAAFVDRLTIPATVAT